MHEPLRMDDPERRDDTLDVAPEEHPRSRCTQIAKPVLAGDTSDALAQGMSVLLEEHPEMLVVLDEFKHLHDDITGTRIRHDALYLAHLVQPQLPEVIIDLRIRFAPKLQQKFTSGGAVLDLKDRGSERSLVAGGDRVTDEVKPIVK